jgi:WbqC-like protein family
LKVAVHQPNFLPWLGFFAKMDCVDAFVVLDSVQFAKRSFTNRCPIEGPTGEATWMTVPVKSTGRYHQIIRDVEVTGDDWREPTCQRLRHRWAALPFGRNLIARSCEIIRDSGPRLVDLNVQLLHLIRETLDIKTPLHLESDFDLPADIDPTERIVQLTKELGGDVYVSGRGGAAYLDHLLMSKAGVELVVGDFSMPSDDDLARRFGDKTSFELLSRTGGLDCRLRMVAGR